MKYFDLHCDTLSRLYFENKDFHDKSLMISLDGLPFEKYTQVLAIYSDNNRTDDENYSDFYKILDHFTGVEDSLPDNFSYIIGVEGGKLLSNDIKRLDSLCKCGVKILTLVWKGVFCMGGAHDTSYGLSPFGRKVLYRMFENGMIPDLSHSSDKMFYEVAEICKEEKRKFIVSHSDSRTVRDHRRNITDRMFDKALSSGALVGINLYPEFLAGKVADSNDVIKHIKHFLSLGGEDILSFGCDFDGIEYTPKDIKNVHDMPYLYEKLEESGIPKITLDKIFFENAARFFRETE